MIYSIWKNPVVAIKRDLRIVAFCAMAVAFGVIALGVKISYNQATVASDSGYAALKQVRGDPSVSRAEFRQSLISLVRRKHRAIGTMAGQDIRLIFGNPQQVRRDRGIHVWQYRTEQCVIDIYMRERDGQDARLKAAHHEVRKRRLIKVNGGNNSAAMRNGLSKEQRAGCLQTAFRNYDPDRGGQNYASLE